MPCQHPLAFLEPAVVEQPLPGAQRGKRDRRALDVTERSRLRREDPCGDDCVLGGGAVAVEAGERVHRLADLDIGHVGGNRHDDPGELVRRDCGKTVDGPVELVPGDRGGVDADERLTRPWPRDLDLLDGKLGGAAGRVQADRRHRPGAGRRIGRSFSGHWAPPFSLRERNLLGRI